ncbi:MAG TPA: DUF1569 domain-containing protein [Blastocatellia bacterium]|jgi:hypothetical protein|nr:DUF1569 domain-containing protein [Blastocatellia bacterium]
MKSFLNPTDKKEIFERLSAVRSDSRRRWGRMTSHQMICHLSDSFKFTFGEKDNSSASNLFTRTVVKWIALYAPLPWPRGVKTRPEMDQETGGTPPDDFEPDRRQLVALIERFIAPAKDVEFPPHPLFGDMSEAEWMRWGYLHCDHHLRQFGV